MVKIYFVASIRGGRENADFHSALVRHLQEYGTVLTEHIGNRDLGAGGEIELQDTEIHNRDMAWLGDSTHVVAEVTTASLGVGYEIGRIVERNCHLPPNKRKSILCLYRPQDGRRLSGMINGCMNLNVKNYSTLGEAFEAIDDFFLKMSPRR